MVILDKTKIDVFKFKKKNKLWLKILKIVQNLYILNF